MVIRQSSKSLKFSSFQCVFFHLHSSFFPEQTHTNTEGLSPADGNLMPYAAWFPSLSLTLLSLTLLALPL